MPGQGQGQGQGQDKRLPTASAAGAADPDPIFGSGLGFLLGKGVKERGARSFLGAMRKEIGDLATAELLAAAEREDVSDPLAWLRAAATARGLRAKATSAADDRQELAL